MASLCRIHGLNHPCPISTLLVPWQDTRLGHFAASWQGRIPLHAKLRGTSHDLYRQHNKSGAIRGMERDHTGCVIKECQESFCLAAISKRWGSHGVWASAVYRVWWLIIYPARPGFRATLLSVSDGIARWMTPHFYLFC